MNDKNSYTLSHKYIRKTPILTAKIINEPVEESQTQSALKIQKLLRGYFTRKNLYQKKISCIKIQAAYRGYISRKKIQKYLLIWKSQKEIDFKIQENREKLLKKEIKKQNFSLLSSSRIKFEENELKLKSCTLIQKIFRGWRGRKLIKKLRLERNALEEKEGKKNRIS